MLWCLFHSLQFTQRIMLFMIVSYCDIAQDHWCDNPDTLLSPQILFWMSFLDMSHSRHEYMWRCVYIICSTIRSRDGSSKMICLSSTILTYSCSIVDWSDIGGPGCAINCLPQALWCAYAAMKQTTQSSMLHCDEKMTYPSPLEPHQWMIPNGGGEEEQRKTGFWSGIQIGNCF